jgi:hypothetical protein
MHDLHRELRKLKDAYVINPAKTSVTLHDSIDFDHVRLRRLSVIVRRFIDENAVDLYEAVLVVYVLFDHDAYVSISARVSVMSLVPQEHARLRPFEHWDTSSIWGDPG